MFWLYFFTYTFVLTYICWGFVVAFETTLAMGGNQFAIRWIRKRSSLSFYMIEVYAFYPLIFITYAMLEWLPFHIGFSKNITKFDISQAIYNTFKDEIDG